MVQYPAHAQADVTAPVLKSATLASPKVVGPDVPLAFSWTVEDQSALSIVAFNIYGPGRKYFTAYTRQTTSRVGNTHTGSAGVSIDTNSWPSGDYQVSSIEVVDAAGNRLTNYPHGFSLDSLNFKVGEDFSDAEIPRLSGNAKLGEKLIAISGVSKPMPDAIEYRWLADGVDITDVSSDSLVLGPELVGKRIAVEVTLSKSGFNKKRTISAETTPVLSGHIILGAAVPSIIGTPTVGNTLTAAPGTWSPAGVELAYQWSADGEPITGATKNNLDLAPAHAGKAITLAVTGTKAGYATATKTSTATAKVSPATIRVAPVAPTSVAATGRYTVPSTQGVDYRVNGTPKAAGTYASGYTKVTITAVAKPGYVLSGTASWVLDLSKKTVTALAPSVNYTTKTITVPRTTGVAYSIDGVSKAAGTHKVTTYATVTAKASAANYTVAAKTWKYDLRTAVTPAKPVFSASANTVKIPAKTGVTYYVNNVLKKAGTHKFTGTGTVTTKASSGSYKLAGTTSWKFDNRNTVTPTKPVFSASGNTVKIPAKTGVTYYVNNVAKKAGTHRYTGNVTVTTKASSGSYKLAGTQKWTARL